jgi:hypothetical protein
VIGARPWVLLNAGGYSLRMRPIRAIVGSSLLGLGAALLVTRRKLEAERRAHQETVLALETIKQVATPRDDSVSQ